jgi:dolichyl-phosphate-mannose--protein O-mannosyl transferase
MSDSALNVEGRFILTDGFLHTFTVLAIGSVVQSEFFNEYSWPWLLWLSFSSLCLAFAISVKQTAYSLFAFFIYHHAVAACRNHWNRIGKAVCSVVVRVVVLLAISLSFHWVMYALHIILLPYHGRGDGMLPEWWLEELVNESHPRPPILNGAKLGFKVRYYYQMLHQTNMQINGTHPSGSKWHEWPFLTGHNVAFWGSSGRRITAVGNPMLWIPLAYFIIGFSVVVVPYLAVLGRLTEELVDVIGFVFGYWASLLPFALVPRTLHLYHYLIPLIFLVLSFTSCVEALLTPKWSAFVLVLAVAVVSVGFVLFIPIQYGLPSDDPGYMIWKTYS